MSNDGGIFKDLINIVSGNLANEFMDSLKRKTANSSLALKIKVKNQKVVSIGTLWKVSKKSFEGYTKKKLKELLIG